MRLKRRQRAEETAAEGAGEDPLPADLLHLPGAVHRHHRARRDPDRARVHGPAVTALAASGTARAPVDSAGRLLVPGPGLLAAARRERAGDRAEARRRHGPGRRRRAGSSQLLTVTFYVVVSRRTCAAARRTATTARCRPGPRRPWSHQPAHGAPVRGRCSRGLAGHDVAATVLMRAPASGSVRSLRALGTQPQRRPQARGLADDRTVPVGAPPAVRRRARHSAGHRACADRASARSRCGSCWCACRPTAPRSRNGCSRAVQPGYAEYRDRTARSSRASI